MLVSWRKIVSLLGYTPENYRLEGPKMMGIWAPHGEETKRLIKEENIIFYAFMRGFWEVIIVIPRAESIKSCILIIKI